MPLYTILWTSTPPQTPLKPGDDYAPLAVPGKSGSYWYKELPGGIPPQDQLDPIPKYWEDRGFFVCNRYIEAANPTALAQEFAKLGVGP
jgi:hypothetical protein